MKITPLLAALVLAAPTVALADSTSTSDNTNINDNSVRNNSRNTNVNNNGNDNLNVNRNSNKNVANENSQGQGQGQGQAQGQGQQQGQGQNQGQSVQNSGNQRQGIRASGNSMQGQSVNDSGNSRQGQLQGQTANNGGQANTQNSALTTIYMPEPYIAPLPNIDFGQAQINDVACPTAGLIGGVSASDTSYDFRGGSGNNVSISAGVLIPLANRNCRKEQDRIRGIRARNDAFAFIEQCVKLQRSGVRVDPAIFPGFEACAAVSVLASEPAPAPMPMLEPEKPVRGLW
jgi:hypothetical protein